MQLLLLLAMLLTSSGEPANAAASEAALQPQEAITALTALAESAAAFAPPPPSAETPDSVVPFVTEGSSMSPAIESGDLLSVDTGYYRDREVHRGDIIVFRAPDERAFVKRVVGLPGETIRLDRSSLYVNGKKSPDMTLKGSATISDNIELGKDELYVLGDNYAHSYDSRYIGPVRIQTVIGKVMKIEKKARHHRR